MGYLRVERCENAAGGISEFASTVHVTSLLPARLSSSTPVHSRVRHIMNNIQSSDEHEGAQTEDIPP